jgi:DNA adenine methylase
MSTNTRSVLRYPGSKARFVEFIANAIRLNGLRFDVFAEPFCGGASVSIALLEKGVVDNIALNDADPLIADLWDTIFCPNHSEWLADQVLQVPLTIDEWKRQKSLEPTNPRESALKCLYLNRTSFNGILHKAGPIGGWEQVNRTLDARFNRERLAQRIRELSSFSDRVVSVANNDWENFCERTRENASTFFFFDPPFFHKAESLYGYYFTNKEHSHLRDYLNDLTNHWMLSYDDAPEVRALYLKHTGRARVIDSTYSAHPMGGASFVGRELFFSNLSRLPSPAQEDAVHIGLTIRQFKRGAKHGLGLTRIPTAPTAIA